MDKIRIQFNEFDYQVYHNYCLRYYSILDTTRKRSIHLFLELFEKEILPVGEHDLGEAGIFFSKKCAELVADYDPMRKNNASIDLPQFQVCREMPFLIGDFEKIYRLIEKTGLTPNYLLVVATFSKIIEEEKTAYLSAIGEHDRKKVASVAPGIADIIRARLGSDNGWESVLYELTRIVRKFNLSSPDQKIDQNLIYLIGPAVVSQFNANIGYEEIQSTLERYFKERELAVFESLLNNKPFLPDYDTDSESSDQQIFEMLTSITSGNVDQKYLETDSDPGPAGTADLPAVISSGQEYAPYPVKIQEDYVSRFDIDVGSTLKSSVVLAEKRFEPPYNVYRKPGISQYSVLFMGIVILILFGITVAAMSGIWSPVKSSGNNDTEINSILSIVQNLQKNSTMAAKNDPTVYLRSPPVQTNSTGQSKTAQGTKSSADINKNFMRIAFGPDNTKIKKVAGDTISVAITGDYRDNDTETVEQFKTQFNKRSSTTQFHSGVKLGDQADIVMNFLPAESLNNIENLEGASVSKNSTTGDINYIHTTVVKQFVTIEVVYINSDLTGDRRTHWTLRGLLYEMGFPGETNDYPESIFNADSELTPKLNDMDWNVVTLMYNKKITTGMTFDRVKALLLV